MAAHGMKLRLALIICALSSGMLTYPAVGRSAEPVGKIQLMDASELADRLEARRQGAVGFHVVDLRNEADYQIKFIPGAINIPSTKLTYVAEKIFSKSDAIVFYSHAGTDHVSESAVIFMKNKGFKNCFVLIGGIGSWSLDFQTPALIDKGDSQ
jgi:rhodanese-related sulfurtransferase